MVTALAIALVAVVAGAAAAAITRWAITASIARGIGGRKSADPVAEHLRMLRAANAQTKSAESRAALLTKSFDALTSGVVVSDAAGQTIAKNAAASDGSMRLHERSLVDAAVNEALASARAGQSTGHEVEVSGPPRRTLYVHASPVVDGRDAIGALAVIDDVTDHHRIESTRRDFVANLSHELRTPVGALSLLAEMVADEQDPEVRSQLSGRLIIETDRMTHTINDLLELSRIEAEGEFGDVVGVQALLDEAVERTKVAAEAASINVVVLSPSEAIDIQGNRDQLLSAVVNLVDNAIKYSDQGDSVGLRARTDGDTVWLKVQDTGRGIPARDIDRIFERFYRIDRSRDSSTGGSGIGLAIVRHVALNHGGSVDVQSFEGEGSTFTIELPRRASVPVDPVSADESL